MADAFVEHDVELRLAERRRHLVLDDFHAHMIADHHFTILDRRDAPHVEPDGRSEEHTSELQSRLHLVCRLLLEKKNRASSPTSPASPPPAHTPGPAS